MLNIDPATLPRGRVIHVEVGNNSGERSRAFNPVEADPKFHALEEGIEDAIEKTRAKYAQKFLAYYRKRMKEHNTRNHVLTITAAMGSTGIRVNGKTFEFSPMGMYKRDFPVCLLLAELEQALNWDWAAYLDGERIN